MTHVETYINMILLVAGIVSGTIGALVAMISVTAFSSHTDGPTARAVAKYALAVFAVGSLLALAGGYQKAAARDRGMTWCAPGEREQVKE